ncbi:hypothetical protein RAS12_08150 [Achromobacter seleniivolatilans]|uniref:Uncharacterized protein n=1 Tax=Achromobacter seleniivolatilans TaxID=3047478 RepID=A0ABY9M5W9_9BURK|nr:hypothetical protein [Achromobacter sp. R39]WMD22340.1 hypothetical protein RAS12_08150 [Achromobacter sp. R39]
MQFNIKDSAGNLIGVADVQTSPGAVMCGSFTPAPGFARYAALFQELEQAANGQLLKDADRLTQDITGHAFTATGPLPLPTSAPVEDLQIMSGGISFKVQDPAVGKAAT